MKKADIGPSVIGSVIVVLVVLSAAIFVAISVSSFSSVYLSKERCEKDILVVDKTTEIVPAGFASKTVYLVLGNDSKVYHTTDWRMWEEMKINETYHIVAENQKDWGHATKYWVIKEVIENGNKGR